MKSIFLLFLSALVLSGCATPTQMMLDAEVKRLCAIDGGIKVYETVSLPGDKFNEWGQVNFYKPTHGENALGEGYQFKDETTYYRHGNPAMYRGQVQVFRKIDQKLLGESIFYIRGGGDLPGPWHGSSYHCPEEYGRQDLFKKIFRIDQGGKAKEVRDI